MLVSGVQQHDLVINIYVYNYILFLVCFFSVTVYYKILEIPMLYSKCLLFTYSIYGNVHLLISYS